MELIVKAAVIGIVPLLQDSQLRSLTRNSLLLSSVRLC